MANLAEVHRRARLARDRAWAEILRRSFAGMGRGCLLPPSTSIRGAENITLGSGVRLGSNCALSALGHGTETPAIEIADGVDMGTGSRIHAIGNARVFIGAGTSMVGANSVLAGVDVHIGPGVLMAWNSGVTDSDHGFADPLVPIKDQPLDRQAPVRIEGGAWLGNNAMVLPGVTIGRNAVVGANAVVTADVADHTVVVGAPARPVIATPR